MVRATRIRCSLLVAVVGVLAACAAVVTSTSTTEDSCTLFAAVGGSDTAAGTAAQPFASVQRLSDALRPGDVGCLGGGTYTGNVAMAHGGTDVAPVVLRSRPGERATIVGRLVVTRNAPFTTVADLDLEGLDQADDCTGPCPSPTVNASNVSFVGNDVSNDRTAICFVLGDRFGVYGAADHVLLQGNRIHDCGVRPSSNLQHGIYVQRSRGARIVGNYIYDNADRGIQLYPDVQDAVISYNVIDGNGEGLIFSGDGRLTSNGNVVAHNVLSNPRVRRNVESYYAPGTTVGQRNVLRDNCLYAEEAAPTARSDGGDARGSGYTSTGNRVVRRPGPGFQDAAAGDFRLRRDSPCLTLFADAAATPGTGPVPLSSDVPGPLDATDERQRTGGRPRASAAHGDRVGSVTPTARRTRRRTAQRSGETSRGRA